MNKRVRKYVIGYIITLVTVVACMFVTFSFILMRTKVVSSSMEPFLETGKTVYVNRLAYLKKDVQRGDVVWFKGEDVEILVKRVIGLPGDKITFEDGYVFVNDVVLDESAYLDEDVETMCYKIFYVPEGCYFMLGDNRNNSKDSRFFQYPYISKDDIIGKYIGRERFWEKERGSRD